jgi:hypothetical protein
VKTLHWLAAGGSLVLAVACGARTNLDLDDVNPPAPVGSGGAGAGGAAAGAGGAGVAGSINTGGSISVDGGTDADADAPVDAGPDVVVTDAGCQSDDACDDQIACTLDVCDLEKGVCTHAPRDVLCDDGVFCTGAERCDAALGCVVTPVGCNDGVACTVDACDEGKQGCTHTPDDGLCPLSHKCGEFEGCYALAYAHSPGDLYEVRLPSGQVTLLGSTGVQLTDLALVSNTKLYGLSSTSLFDMDTTTGEATFLSSTDTSGMVAFDVGPDGRLYVGGGTTLYDLQLPSGQITPLASYPAGWQASGDLAFLQGRLLGTVRTSQNSPDSLAEFDLEGGGATILGSTGFPCIWGLAAFGETLYGLTCNGQVLNINPQTGAASVLSSGGPAFWGASAR